MTKDLGAASPLFLAVRRPERLLDAKPSDKIKASPQYFSGTSTFAPHVPTTYSSVNMASASPSSPLRNPPQTAALPYDSDMSESNMQLFRDARAASVKAYRLQNSPQWHDGSIRRAGVGLHGSGRLVVED